MKPLLLRILKNGLPTAAILAVIGYGMANMAGVYLSSQQVGRANAADEWTRKSTEILSRSLPVSFAAWGFGLVALFEFVLWLIRGNPLPPTPKAAVVPDQTEQLLNDLLKRADAERAAPCPPPPPADNTSGPPSPAVPPTP